MKTVVVSLALLALGVFAVARAQQPAQPGMGSMGSGMMMGMHQQMMGMMQQMGGMMQQMGEALSGGQVSPDQMKRMGDMMKEMGNLMGGVRHDRRADGAHVHARHVEDDGTHGGDTEADVRDDGPAAEAVGQAAAGAREIPGSRRRGLRPA